jgi:hypothetical protein
MTGPDPAGQPPWARFGHRQRPRGHSHSCRSLVPVQSWPCAGAAALTGSGAGTVLREERRRNSAAGNLSWRAVVVTVASTKVTVRAGLGRRLTQLNRG